LLLTEITKVSNRLNAKPVAKRISMTKRSWFDFIRVEEKVG